MKAQSKPIDRVTDDLDAYIARMIELGRTPSRLMITPASAKAIKAYAKANENDRRFAGGCYRGYPLEVFSG